jgi:hypothetical protein
MDIIIGYEKVSQQKMGRITNDESEN